ncbi:PIG-L deacetylase family protein [Psychroflexus halocasei]|uniref:N-acetylglucosaminyl deacetylase, LmbE family n=1 Tax=Psychroflexus halocasei TaxID=908615 RepID=A0A1H4C2X0_9FLAO|nr:PIG-L family deacetylase [Psychroflexus halocasei]SEA54795.1 N-acetylglucosaminyl deacetylase, LmbE family [Psychroflexus halocasei]
MGLASIKYLIKHKLLSIKPNGQYNFLTKKIHKEMDIDLAEKVLATDYFKENLVPQPISYKSWRKIIIFAPHQDDEAIGCGALLTELSMKGCKIDLVFLTDGRPTGENTDIIVEERNNEAKNVAQKLGASLINIAINNVTLEVTKSNYKNLIELLETKYDAIFTPWVLDSPPKHRFCNALLSKVFKKVALDVQTQIYTYQVHTALIPNVYFDYTGSFQAKQNLINIYESQLKAQNYLHLSAGLDAWNTRFLPWSTAKRYVEVYHQIPLKAFNKLVGNYEINLAQTFKGNINCIKSYQNLKQLDQS